MKKDRHVLHNNGLRQEEGAADAIILHDPAGQNLFVVNQATKSAGIPMMIRSSWDHHGIFIGYSEHGVWLPTFGFCRRGK